MRAIPFALCLLAAGCGIISFDIGQDIPEQKVMGSALGGALGQLLPAPLKVTIDIKSQTEAMGTGPASKALLKDLTLTATPHDTPSGNFNFLDEVHLYIEPASGSALPKVEIATLKPVPKGQTTVTFAVVPNVNLLPYINEGSQITSSAKGAPPTKDFTFDGHLTVTVKI